jgi:Protein of unknown function (DUF3613)
MKKEQANRLALLVIVLLTAAPVAMAQETAKPAQPEAPPVATATATPTAIPQPAQPGQEEMNAAGEIVYERLQVGDATQGLLAWQRSGEIASPTPRPIAGDVASRSYERYTKSFEFPIPERMSSIVKSSSASGSGGAK